MASNDGMNVPASNERINLLFKKMLSTTSTSNSFDYFNETAFPANTNIFSNSILQKTPSNTPTYSTITDWNVLQTYLRNDDPNITIDSTWFNSKTPTPSAFQISDDQLSLRFIEIPLDYIENKGAAFCVLDNNGNNILKNVIPASFGSATLFGHQFKYTQSGTRALGPFLTSRGTFGKKFGAPLLDNENGILTFYDVQYTEDNNTNFRGNFTDNNSKNGNINEEMFLTCTKYVGSKGVSSTSLENPSDGSIALQVDDNSRVGIGTTAPLTKLQIGNIGYIRNDNATYGTNNAVLIVVPKNSGNDNLNDPQDALILFRPGADSQAWQQQAHFRISRYENSGTSSRTRLDFALLNGSGGTDGHDQYGEAPTTIMTLLSNGNVGIGTTSPTAGYKLHVDGAIKSGGQILIDGGNSFEYFTGMATDTTVFQGHNSTQLRANNGDIAFYANTSPGTTERMRIKSDGDVGIGETSPDNILHVRGSGPQLLLEGVTDEDAIMRFSSGPSYRNEYHEIVNEFYAAAGHATTNKMHFKVNDGGQANDPGTRMTIRGDGNVGIGTTAPSGKLHTRLVRQTTTYTINHHRSDAGYAAVNVINRNKSDNETFYSNRASIHYLTIPDVFGDTLFTHDIIIRPQNPSLYFDLNLRYASTGATIADAAIPNQNYDYTMIAYQRTDSQPMIIEGDITNNITAHDPTYLNYSQLNIRSISNATSQNREMCLKIGADHKTYCGYLQSVCPHTHVYRICLQPIGGNVGIGTTDPKRKLDLTNTGQITFGDSVNSDTTATGIYWHSDSGYGIYRTAGDWTDPNYQQLMLKWTTGIILDPGYSGSTGAARAVYDRSHVGVFGAMAIGSGYYNTTSRDSDWRDGLIVEGNVGIGTNDPDYKLDVAGDINFTGTLYQNGTTYQGSRWEKVNKIIQYLNDDHAGHVAVNNLFITTSDSRYGNDVHGWYSFYGAGGKNANNGNTDFIIYHKNDIVNDIFVMTETGDISAKSFNSTSDIRHKENIVELENSLEKITSLRAVNYNFKETPDNKSAGLIAQEVYEIIPEAVCKRLKDRWTLDYTTITGYLVDCVKELNKKIDEKDEDMEKMSKEMEKMSKEMEKMSKEMEKEKAKTAKLETQMKDLLERINKIERT
jgi:predicted transcriptional regulator